MHISRSIFNDAVAIANLYKKTLDAAAVNRFHVAFGELTDARIAYGFFAQVRGK